MLERAAGCFESAGRRFLQESNGAIRSRRTLPRHFWKHHGDGPGAPYWFLALLPPSTQRPSPGPSSSTESKNANDAAPPFLDFLYPRNTQEPPIPRLSRFPRRLGLRRRKRTLAGYPRTYVSRALCLHQSLAKAVDVQEESPEADGSQHQETDHLRQLEAEKRLNALLHEQGTDYEKAWTLYVSLRRPPRFSSELLAYLSSSTDRTNQRRAWRCFSRIAPAKLDAYDWSNILRSQVPYGTVSAMKMLCERSAWDSKTRARKVWPLVFTHFIHSNRWKDALELWNRSSQPSEQTNIPSPKQLVSRVKESTLLVDARALGSFLLRNRERVSDFTDLASCLLDRVVRSSSNCERITTGGFLQVLQIYRSLNIANGYHYFHLIKTLQNLGTRSAFIRSVAVYRHLRWQLPDEKPPRKLLGAFLDSLVSFEITSGIRYFLSELARFYSPPSTHAYRLALIGFSRAGDVAQVNEVFSRLVADHGMPQSRRLLTPLLYVHARHGNVEETLRQFQRISEEFKFEQNTVCWNIRIAAHANADDFPGAFSTFAEMLRKGIEPNSYTYGTVMGICANRGDTASVRRLLSEAKKHQVQITMPLLDTVVEAFTRHDRMDLAERIAVACQSMNVPGSRVRMWNILLTQYAFRVDLKSIARVRLLMRINGVRPDSMSYSALMLAFTLIREPDTARRLLRTLHRNQHLHATQFHYAIVLMGYVKARNRDMAHVIFREIEERFGRVGLSAYLLKLKAQIQRDFQSTTDGLGHKEPNLHLKHAESSLERMTTDIDTTSLASKLPSPGIGGASPSAAFDTKAYEYLITAYASRGATQQAKEIFDRFAENRRPSASLDNESDSVPFNLASSLMTAYLKDGDHDKVAELWHVVFSRGVELARPIDLDELLSSGLPPSTAPSMPEPFVEPPRPSLPTGGPNNEELLISPSPGISVPEKQMEVLGSQRFILSRPLSVYIQSLAMQNEFKKVRELCSEVEAAGFQLSTFNWTRFVEVLSTSDEFADQLRAFQMFEQKFSYHFPGWAKLRLGSGFMPNQTSTTAYLIDYLKRRRKLPRNIITKTVREYWTQFRPWFMQPTYTCVVKLAAALLKIRNRSILDGGAELRAVHAIAPKTLNAIAQMPYLRDSVQGTILRGRADHGNRSKDWTKHEPFVWTGGVLGGPGWTRMKGGIRRARREPRLVKRPFKEVSSKFKTSSSNEPAPDDLEAVIAPEDQQDLSHEHLLLRRRIRYGSAVVEPRDSRLGKKKSVPLRLSPREPKTTTSPPTPVPTAQQKPPTIQDIPAQKDLTADKPPAVKRHPDPRPRNTPGRLLHPRFPRATRLSPARDPALGRKSKQFWFIDRPVRTLLRKKLRPTRSEDKVEVADTTLPWLKGE
ncbi:hypothetical protein N7474_009302 [Penicillium riverlandense]|uniref:uncharacterized protein n=1 Tax=Penicillium riverlandense TaxID=1903569 RepID=UPI00254910D3|nr:uncharacterized protein N7474_009302 [Penicillium riverlandense]KAJ5808033.1 hypothetical protein N7474_009302 [Penicillium riverlandense]